MAAAEIPRKIWTREEAHALVDLGVPNAEKLELINGELINRMGKKRLHVIWKKRVEEWLRFVFGSDFVEAEDPVEVALADQKHNEPEPDLKVLRKPFKDYTSTPLSEDVVLVVEISDSTVQFDLTVKAALYARAGIQEYWVVDIPDQLLIGHRNPRNERYDNVVRLLPDEEIAPLSAPQTFFSLNKV